MKTAVRVMLGIWAIALLCVGPVFAKKDKKGGGPPNSPRHHC